MKHLLPAVEHFIRTDCIIVDLTDLVAIRGARMAAEFTPVFGRDESGQYGLLPVSAAETILNVQDILINVKTVNADDPLTKVSAAFNSCSLAIVLN
ncbi:AAA family ATPase, partial [Clostridium perfringens]